MASAWGNSWGKSWGNAWGLLNAAIIPEDAYYYHSRRRYVENPPKLKAAIKKRERLAERLEEKQNAIISAPVLVDANKLNADILRLQQDIAKNEEKIRVIIMRRNERMAEIEEEEFLMLAY
jgi:hypothetical protein